MSSNIVITIFSTVTVILLFTVIDVSSETRLSSTTNSNDCKNKTCTGNDCKGCSEFPVTLVLVSVVICLVPPITWGMVICYACKSDPMKRRRRMEQRRRRQAREAFLRSMEENVRMNDLPPSYQEAQNCPLYRPDETAIVVANNSANEQNSGDGMANHAYSEHADDSEEPPPSYAYSGNANEEEEPPPPSYAFAISGHIV